MVKEKKILTEILPKSAPVSREVVDKLKRQQIDGKVTPLHSRNLQKGNCTGARNVQQIGRPDAKGKERYKTVGERERFNI